MNEIVRVGVDLAKRVIQVHAVDAAGKVVNSRALPRSKFMTWCAQLPQGCVVAMEASGGAHHWARKLQGLGLAPRIMAAQLVAPYRMQGTGGKNDANDDSVSRKELFEPVFGCRSLLAASGVNHKALTDSPLFRAN